MSSNDTPSLADLWGDEPLAVASSVESVDIDSTLVQQASEEDESRAPQTLSIFKHENRIEVSARVEQDEFTAFASRAFDVPFEGETITRLWSRPDVPEAFGIGLFVGASGSGKSSLLRLFGASDAPIWSRDKAIVSHFATPQEAVNRLMAVGLNTIPAWLRPYHVLSTGEKFRADLARQLESGAVIDEFTSVVNRDVACATSRAMRRYVTAHNLQKIVIASCHRDIVDWLEPDWLFDTDTGELVVGRSLCRPSIELSLYACSTRAWAQFAKHHYLSADLNPAARCMLATWRENVVGFVAALPLPSGTVENAWRGHRLVVLPDFQGLGIGPRLADAMAARFKAEGKRYYVRSSHERLRQYRLRSPLWRGTGRASTRSKMGNTTGKVTAWHVDESREGYTFEYIGEAPS